jgi:hypothetical protein
MKQNLKDSCELLARAAGEMEEGLARLANARPAEAALLRRKMKKAAEGIRSLSVAIKNGEV